MKIKEVFTEGFWAGVASGLTGMDYINKGGNFETSVDQLSDDDFKKVFAMSKQQFVNLDRKIQGKLLQQAAEKLNLGRTVVEPEVDQEPTQQTQFPAPTQTTQTTQSQTAVPMQQGFVTAVVVPTAGGERKFWYDGKNWKEYFGSNWPQDIQTSQTVVDDKVISYLAKQVQLKNTEKVPYGTTKQAKRKS